MLKIIKIDGNDIKSLNDFYDIISSELKFPDYFGKNLDALNDILSAGEYFCAEKKIEIKWINYKTSEKYIGENYNKLVLILKNISNKNFKIDFINGNL